MLYVPGLDPAVDLSSAPALRATLPSRLAE